MKESDFIAQNKRKWADFEKELASKSSKPNKITYHYIDTIDDLSYAGTHYPNRMVRSYLNGTAQILALKIYRSQKKYRQNIARFWSTHLPLVMFEARREFLISFLTMVLAVAIGIFSSIQDSTFANTVMGDEYIATTLQNIENDDPMAIYKNQDQTKMFLDITFNNIRVSAFTYLASIFLGIGTLIVLIQNGIMLGAFQYFFIERGLFFESFLTVWQHGTIEISCIILAGTAGLVLARGILFPGTLSRINAFRYAGRKSLIIMMGLMPLLIYSGAIEGFVTRYTEMHWIIRLSTILLSLGFVLVYFVWYPRKLARSKDLSEELHIYMQPMQASDFSFKLIQKNARLIWEAALNLIRLRKPFLLTAILLSLAIASGITYTHWSRESIGLAGQNNEFFYMIQLFNSKNNLVFFVTNTILVFTSVFFANWALHKMGRLRGIVAISFKKAFIPIMAMSIFCALFSALFFKNIWSGLLLQFLIPFLGLLAINSWMSGRNIIASFRKTFRLMLSSYWKLMGMVAVQLVILICFGLFSQAIIITLATDLINEVVFNNNSYFITYIFMSSTALCFILLTSYTILYSSLALAWFSIVEINTANILKGRVEKLLPIEDDEQYEKVAILNPGRFKWE